MNFTSPTCNMPLCVEKKKLLVCHNKVAKQLQLFNYFFKKIQKQPREKQKQPLEEFFKQICPSKFCKLHKKTPVLETFLIKLQLSPCKLFKKRLQHKCFPVKFAKLLRTSILKNICKRLLLEVFYKKAVLKNFAIFIGQKQLVIKCSLKKL